jgi:hypothetical protein
MGVSHKTQAVLQFLVPSALLYIGVAAFLINQKWPSWVDLQENSLGFALVGLAAMLVQDLFPKPLKEFLVFWKISNRLPGYRAFSEVAQSDAGIEESKIANFQELSASGGHTQQTAFYCLYDGFRNHPSVSHHSQRYIAWRDLTSFLALLSVVSLPVAGTFDHPRAIVAGLVLTGSSLLILLMTSLAARNAAMSLTKQVLILHSLKGA